MKKIREVYELKNGNLLLVFSDGETLSQVNEEKLFADFEEMRSGKPFFDTWTPNAYYDVQGIVDRRKRLERGQSA